MQKFILQLFILLILPLSSSAQRLVYNEKAPKMEAKDIIAGQKTIKDLPTYIDFFVLNSPQNEEQLEILEKAAKIYNQQINFLLISKDDRSELEIYFKDRDPSYTVMVDFEGKTFSNFDVKFIPFSVMIDRKGNFIWQGKNSTLSESIIRQVIK